MKLLPEVFDKTKRKDVKRLQDILVFLGGSIGDSTDDIKNRRFGTHTADALKVVKKKAALPRTARVNKSTIRVLNRKAIEKYYATKTQTANLHRTLTKVARIAGLEYDLAKDKKARRQGRQTSALRTAVLARRCRHPRILPQGNLPDSPPGSGSLQSSYRVG